MRDEGCRDASGALWHSQVRPREAQGAAQHAPGMRWADPWALAHRPSPFPAQAVIKHTMSLHAVTEEMI